MEMKNISLQVGLVLLALTLLCHGYSHFETATPNELLSRSMYCVLSENGVDATTLTNTFCQTVTLAQLFTNTSSYFKTNTTIIFLPGQHRILQTSILRVSNVQGLVITGSSTIKSVSNENDSLVEAEVVCHSSQRSGFLFSNMENLKIISLTISNCGVLTSYEPRQFSPPSRNGKMATFLFANVTNLTLDRVLVRNGYGYGMYGVNILGRSIISDSHFTNNTMGGNAFLKYVDLEFTAVCLIMHHLLIQDSSFTHGKSILRLTPPVSVIGAGLSVRLEQKSYAVNITLIRTNATSNVARLTPNFQFESFSTVPNLVTLKHCTASHGTVLFGGASGFQYSYSHFFPPFLPACQNSGILNSTSIQLTSNNFIDNIGAADPSFLNELTSTALEITFLINDSTSVPHHISVVDCTVSNNVGGNGIGFYAQILSVSSSSDTIIVEIINSSFVNNTSTALRTNRMSVMLLVRMSYLMISNVTIAHNIGTGLLADGSNIYFEGVNTFQNNSAYNGGGLALYGQSFLYLKPNTSIRLIDNVAGNVGGGIYVSKTFDSTIKTQCFFQYSDTYDTLSIDFRNNSAGLAGNDLYGGSLETCLTSTFNLGWKIFPLIAGLQRHGYVPDVSSKPTRVCLCNDTTGETNCTHFVHSISAYPGSLFDINAIAVGQMLCFNPAGSPSAIYAALLPNENNGLQGSIPNGMIAQETGRYCSVLTYQVNSINKNEVIVLTVEKTLEQSQRSQKLISKAKFWCTFKHEVLDIFIELPVYINVTLLPCPLGFELSPQGMCDCASALKEQNIACSINTKTIHRQSPMWIGTKSQQASANSSVLIYLTQHTCPFDYCIPDDIDFPLNDSDKQCAFNRSGVLCGTCRDNLSNVLGVSECQKCSNLYLLLLIPFAIAGVLLILLLMTTNLTVTVGTINGLLFYANIIRQNQTAFFPPHSDTNVLTVFIAWLNLDFGITSCFYNGMDTYAKAWLQFLFPFYIWVLTAIIIISSRHLSFMAKICRKNIVQVLATLFLLSYTKLQRAIITGLSFTMLSQSNNCSQAVWLSDPSLNYLQGKHIYLFIASISIFLFLFLPYTLTILFGPCLLSRSNYKVLSCVQRLKPLFDAYLGPYKDKHRYWTGLLLFARMLLVVLSAVNVFGDPSVNLLAAAIVSYVLTVLVWQSGGVYKIWVLTALESCFLLNVGLLSTITLYIRVSGGNQLIAVHLSCGIAFTVFVALLLYHTLVYTPINITERKIWISLKSFLLRTSLCRQFFQKFTSQNTTYRDSESDELELTETATSDTDPDVETDHENVNWEYDSGNPTEGREVTSMLISFNALREPTFECGTVQR